MAHTYFSTILCLRFNLPELNMQWLDKFGLHLASFAWKHGATLAPPELYIDAETSHVQWKLPITCKHQNTLTEHEVYQVWIHVHVITINIYTCQNIMKYPCVAPCFCYQSVIFSWLYDMYMYILQCNYVYITKIYQLLICIKSLLMFTAPSVNKCSND